MGPGYNTDYQERPSLCAGGWFRGRVVAVTIENQCVLRVLAGVWRATAIRWKLSREGRRHVMLRGGAEPGNPSQVTPGVMGPGGDVPMSFVRLV